MKRLTALLIAFSMILAFAPSVIAEDVKYTSVDEETVNRVFGLGLAPFTTKEQFQEDAPLTRGELAWVLDNLYNYRENIDKDAFVWDFYGDGAADNTQMKEPPETLTATYEDVLPSYWAYEKIENVTQAGLMNGVSATQFNPDGAVTIDQLVKTLVVLLGYDAQARYAGGYPTGYTKVALDLGLLKGVRSTGTVTSGAIVKALDNCLSAKLMTFDSVITEGGSDYLVSVQSNDTFLKGYLGLDVVEGVMTDTPVTGLLGETRADDNQFIVDNVLLRAAAENASAYYGLIGREVECYYVADEASDKADRIVYAALSGKDTVTEIDPGDFISCKNGVLSYYKDGKSKKVTLSDFFAVIYNGKALASYTEEIFDVADGKLTVVENYSDDMNVVFIESYESWYVKSVDYDAQKVFNYMGGLYDFSTVVLEDYDFVSITKPDGTAGALEDIIANSIVDVAVNDNVVSMRLSDKKEAGDITSIDTSSADELLIGLGENEFEMAEAYRNYDERLDIKIGSSVTLYLNSFGKIAWMVYGQEDTYNTGYVINAIPETKVATTKAIFKIFDTSAKAAVTYYASPKKVVVSDSDGVEITCRSVEEVMDACGSYRGIMRYTLNDEKEITYIELPILDVRKQTSDKLTLFAHTTDEDRYRGNNFGGKAVSNSSTKVICVDPENLTDEDGYEIRTVSGTFASEKEYVVKCYSTRQKSKLAEFIVYETASKAAAIKYDTGINFAIVKKMYNAYDDAAGETLPAIKAFASEVSTGTSSTPEALLMLDPECKIYTPLSGEFEGKIEPGDLIFYGTNKDGYVDEIRVIWDQNGVNPDSPTGAPGTIVDSKGYYGTGDDAPTFGSDLLYTGDVTQLPNPLCLQTSTGVHYARKSNTFSAGPLLIHYGFLARNNDGALEITSQDLTVSEYDETGLDGKHITRVWAAPTNTILVKLSGKNDVEIAYSGTTALNPFRTSDDYNADCSRVIVFSNYALMTKMIVINGYFD